MILVAAQVRPSPIHGLGLFAVNALVKGTPVARWDSSQDYVLSDTQYASLPLNLKLFLQESMWRGAGAQWYGTTGAGRFINHARGSASTLIWTVEGRTSVARRDIQKDEELTEDYSEFDLEFFTYAHELTP